MAQAKGKLSLYLLLHLPAYESDEHYIHWFYINN